MFSYTLTFTTALFIIAKTWKQPKCGSVDERVEKRTDTHTHTHTNTHTQMEYYSAIKKKEILPFVTRRMDIESLMLNEVRHRKANTNHLTYIHNL